MNLFNVESDFIGKLDTKPRDATDNEVFAYLRWQRERRGLPDLNGQELHYAERKGGRRWERGHCLGATYGNQTARPEREQGRWKPAQFENGSYSLLMPGYAINRATVTMETLNDDGEVAASQTLPVEPKKGGVVWTKETIRAACGPVPKAAKPRKGRATPTAEPAGKAKRTPAHERAIRMAWAQRKARRRAEQVSADRFAEIRRLSAAKASAVNFYNSADERADTLHTDLMAARAEVELQRSIAADHMRMREQVQDELRTALHWKAEYQKWANDWGLEAHQAKAKRRRAVLLARDLQTRLNREYKLVDHYRAKYTESREWTALLEEENAALTRKPPALRLVA